MRPFRSMRGAQEKKYDPRRLLEPEESFLPSLFVQITSQRYVSGRVTELLSTRLGTLSSDFGPVFVCDTLLLDLVVTP